MTPPRPSTLTAPVLADLSLVTLMCSPSPFTPALHVGPLLAYCPQTRGSLSPKLAAAVLSGDERCPAGRCRSAAGQSCLTIWSIRDRASAPTPRNSADPRERCQARAMKYKLGTGDKPRHCTKVPCASLTSGIATHALWSR